METRDVNSLRLTQGGAPAVAVTGASGYIGRAVVKALLQAQTPVVALGRRPVGLGAPWRKYDLGEPIAPDLLEGVGAVIHLAAETDRGAAADVEREVAAVKDLVGACRARGVRLVFVSSQTAQPEAPTNYGRAKWLCEQVVLDAGGVVVRPGQVYGGDEAGLFGSLCRLVSKSPLAPAFLPEPKVQPVHVEDLARGLISCARDSAISGVIEIAAPVPLGFTTFLRQIARIRFRRRVIAVPVPIGLVVGLARLPVLPAAIREAAQRLDSLARLPMMATAPSLARLGLQLRPLSDGLSRSGRSRRRLLVEADTLLGYLLRGAAPRGCVRRYVRAVEALYEGQPLGLAAAHRRWPGLLVLVDQPLLRRHVPAAAFWTRIDLATVCAESSAETADRFLILKGGHRLSDGIILCWHLGIQAICMAFAVLLGRQLSSRVPRLSSEELGA